MTAAANRKRAHPSVLAAVALDPLMNEAARRLDGALFELGEQIPQGKFVILLSVLIANVINANSSLDAESSIEEVGALIRSALEIGQLASASAPAATN